jgi:hypothetical protein
MSSYALVMNPEIVIQGRGGYIVVGNYRFEIEMLAGSICHCIYFPHRELDKSLKEARKVIQALIDLEPEGWELAEYDAAHGFYNAMTVNERLYASGLCDEFHLALDAKDKNSLVKILSEVEVPDSDIREIVKNT